MVRPGLRPNAFKDDPTRAPPEHFEANFSYGCEKLAKQKRAQHRANLSKKQWEAAREAWEATGSHSSLAESEATGTKKAGSHGKPPQIGRKRGDREATDGDRREATGSHRSGGESGARGKPQTGSHGKPPQFGRKRRHRDQFLKQRLGPHRASSVWGQSSARSAESF